MMGRAFGRLGASWWGVWVCVVLLAAVGCGDDGAANGSGSGSGAAADAGGGGGSDAGRDVSGGDDAERDAQAEDAGRDVAPPECAPGARECVDATTARVCLSSGAWGTEPCAEGEACELGGECRPQACTPGVNACLDASTVATCTDEGTLRPLNVCPEGRACVDGECRSEACAAAARAESYLGCDYLAVDLPNLAFSIGSTPDAPMGVVLTNPDPNVTVTASVLNAQGDPAALVGSVTIEPPAIAGGAFEPVTVQSEILEASGLPFANNLEVGANLEIPPGGLAILLLRPTLPLASTVQAQAWRVRTNSPVAAYQFSPYCCNYSYTNDASLLLPIATLGTDYINLGVPAWNTPADPAEPEYSGSRATLTIVASKPNTEIEIELAPGVEVTPDVEGEIVVQNNRVTTTLQAQQVMHLFSAYPQLRGVGALPLGDDLSGAKIHASAPVAVFSGHECTFYPQDQGACDHLEEQIFPTDTWGDAFALVPPILRATNPNLATETTFWKVVARDDGTTVTLSAPYADLSPVSPGFAGVPDCLNFLIDAQTLRLDSGQFCEFGTRAAVDLTGSGPLMVMGIISGQNSTGNIAFNSHAGDPSIFLLPPRNQYRRSYGFLTPTTYFNDYVTLIGSPSSSVRLDGELVDMSSGSPILGSSQVYVHVLIDDGSHTVESDRPVGILVYAYDDYVSYAFTGGLNLLKGR